MKCTFNFKTNATFPDKDFGPENFCQTLNCYAQELLMIPINLFEKGVNDPELLNDCENKIAELKKILWHLKMTEDNKRLYVSFEIDPISFIFPNHTIKEAKAFFTKCIGYQKEKLLSDRYANYPAEKKAADRIYNSIKVLEDSIKTLELFP